MTLDLHNVASTERHPSKLVLRSGALQPGLSYTFTLNASHPRTGQQGVASLTLLSGDPPRGGRCDLSPESEIRLLETAVSFSCSGSGDKAAAAGQIHVRRVQASCFVIILQAGGAMRTLS